MTPRELRANMEVVERMHALGQPERVRYAALEARCKRAEALALEERRLRYEHTLTENDALTRLRAENRRLHLELDMLRRAVRAIEQAQGARWLEAAE